jgi:hypothetical protein
VDFSIFSRVFVSINESTSPPKTDTYLKWKLISLVNFIYIAFVCKGKTGQLTMVLIYICFILKSFSKKYLRWQNTKVVLSRKSNLGTMLLWKVCLSIGFWMPANMCL